MSSSPALTALKKATEALREQYVKANPKSAEAYENAKISGVAGGTNRASIFYSPFPLTFVNANEATAITADGQHLTDFLGNFTAGLFGFSPTPVKEAVAKAMDNGHALGGAPNLMEARVAKAFTSRYASMDLVRFSNTGTEANSYAIHTARAVSGKNKIMMYDGAYHGAWIHGGKMAGPLDTPYEKIIVPYGDADLICNAIRENADDLAAFIMEPVLGAGGVIVPHETFMPGIRALCDKYGILLISDEVITGFGRTGDWSGARHWKVKPDMMTCAKAITSAYYPFGATMIGEKVAEVFENDETGAASIGHGYTYSAHPVGAAAAIACLNETKRMELNINAKERGAQIFDAVNQLKNKYDIIGDVRGGHGLMTALEFVSDQTSKTPLDNASMAKIQKTAYENGAFVRVGGHNIMMSPPLIVTEDHVNTIISALEAGIKSV